MCLKNINVNIFGEKHNRTKYLRTDVWRISQNMSSPIIQLFVRKVNNWQDGGPVLTILDWNNRKMILSHPKKY